MPAMRMARRAVTGALLLAALALVLAAPHAAASGNVRAGSDAGCAEMTVCEASDGAPAYVGVGYDTSYGCYCTDSSAGSATYAAVRKCPTISLCTACAGGGTKCTACGFGAQLQNNGASCAFVNPCSVGGCAACGSSDATKCELCLGGYVLFGGKCYEGSSCPAGVSNCITCARGTSKCSRCVEGFAVIDNKCVAGAKCANSGAPEKCRVCKSTDNKKCTTCVDGYFLRDNKCLPGKPCTKTIANCESCTLSDTTVCLQCANGFVPVGATCVAGKVCSSKVEGCGACAADGVTCVACQTSYVLNGGKCHLGAKCSASNAPANCIACEKYAIQRCYTCEAGYVLVSGQCFKGQKCAGSVSNCLVCSSSSAYNCVKCASDYQLTGNTCTAACYVSNCAQCVSGSANRCKSCRAGYKTNTAGGCVRDAGVGPQTAMVAAGLAVGITAAALSA